APAGGPFQIVEQRPGEVAPHIRSRRHRGLHGIDLQDSRRIAYHRDYIAAMQSAMAAGADVRGYLAWSLLDNLEWSSGRRIRFGLIRVEPDTLERRPKASFAWYRAHIAGAA
ncbi:MAG: family 1 glycosylhydrolase, partial [Roseomonas sp.]|nr:family 1 glycosylhydrolase [Roseomonas sp.]